MQRTTVFWIIAFLLTAATAYYQRVTGPTYELTGTVLIDGKEVRYKLERSHGGSANALVEINTADSSIHGYLEWKRYKTSDEWRRAGMEYRNGILSAELPHQPPAGKLLYRVLLRRDELTAVAPREGSVVIRFRGDVPLAILIPHILAMFGAMFLSARTGLECFSKNPQYGKLIAWTLGFLFAGGLILGPAVQLYAFNAWWTGWPIGTDLTDNKTAVAFLAWTAAAIAIRKSEKKKRWVLGAAAVTLIIFLVPHSLFGSELDYNTQDAPPAESTR